ncbi:hypothetical protein [Methanobacterium paludis]|uniref:hypothetical protein n=1 Tax=Methanobacterium paludis (strain DSM 25820 / JCM 18151 / SWAN1) TaxID=868131 RepID=UPI00064ECF49|nr:hypothetical protein [Methanobacterium paludis]
MVAIINNLDCIGLDHWRIFADLYKFSLAKLKKAIPKELNCKFVKHHADPPSIFGYEWRSK